MKIQRDPGTLIQYASRSLAKVCILLSAILTFSIIHQTFTSPSEVITPDLLIYYSFLQNSLQPLGEVQRSNHMEQLFCFRAQTILMLEFFRYIYLKLQCLGLDGFTNKIHWNIHLNNAILLLLCFCAYLRMRPINIDLGPPPSIKSKFQCNKSAWYQYWYFLELTSSINYLHL